MKPLFLSVSHPVIVTAGAVVYIPQYLVACAVACYALSLQTLNSVTLADIVQFWQDLEPGTIQHLFDSLRKDILDELFGPPGVPTAALTGHHTNNGSTSQQVRL